MFDIKLVYDIKIILKDKFHVKNNIERQDSSYKLISNFFFFLWKKIANKECRIKCLLLDQKL